MKTLAEKALTETGFLLRVKDAHQREILLVLVKNFIREYANRRYKNVFEFFRKKTEKDNDIILGQAETEIQKIESVNDHADYLCNIEPFN